jgi:CheY-like chemotaxis protein
MVTLDVPVIFITAFPERLLTGERPEPTFLITKPFQPETVRAAIGQALPVHREQAAIEIA